MSEYKNLKHYFPLYMDKWIAGTQELSFEERGFYISLLVWLYSSGKPIKDSDHAARILRCDRRTSRRLWAKLLPKFRLTSAGIRHRLCDELLRNGGKIRNLEANSFPANIDIDIDQEERKEKIHKKEKKVAALSAPDCPHQKIIDLYHKHTPCRRIRTWTGQRPALLKTLWRQYPELEWWAGFFRYVAESDFLCGRSKPKNGDSPFMADLEWLIRPNNFQKIYEGKYHHVRQAQPRTDIGAHVH